MTSHRLKELQNKGKSDQIGVKPTEILFFTTIVLHENNSPPTKALYL